MKALLRRTLDSGMAISWGRIRQAGSPVLTKDSPAGHGSSTSVDRAGPRDDMGGGTVSTQMQRQALVAVGVAGVFMAAGMIFATSAETARGTQLRTDRTDFAAVIRAENAKHKAATRQLTQLRGAIDAQEAAEAAVNVEVAALRARAAAHRARSRGRASVRPWDRGDP